MAEQKGPIATANRIAMSKALGAAFLHHQVEQLEKSVSNSDAARRNKDYRKPSYSSDPHKIYRPRPSPAPPSRNSKPSFPSPTKQDQPQKKDPPKDADIVVVDASVLIHAIAHLKKWCRDGRNEIIIIPLEALNTLDLLKKGSSSLAQRARTASRILEAQVGTNPRIRVQQDDAFVPWDSIPFKDPALPSLSSPSPEWVRRTICCARWELQNAQNLKSDPIIPSRVVLAVSPSNPDTPPDNSPSSGATISPVPLPAPQPNKYEPRSHGSLVARWAQNAGLDLLELSSLPPPPQGIPKDSHIPNNRRSTEHNRRSGDFGRKSPEDDRGHRRAHTPQGANRGRRNSHLRQNDRGQSPNTGGLVERPPAVMAMMEMVSQPSRVVRVLARGEKLDP